MSIIEEKARRLLAEGKVRVLEAGHGRPARVTVEGDHGTYTVVLDDEVVCSCPAFTRRCSHAVAVGLITGANA